MNFKNSTEEGFRRTGALVLLVLAAVACGVVAQIAQARPTVPLSDTAPGIADPQHNTPLELLASRIASRIAGYPIPVQCDSQPVWNSFKTPDGWSGFTESGPVDYTSHDFIGNATVIHLSPVICRALQSFAQAAVKPTQCRILGGQPVPCFDGRYMVSGASNPHGYSLYATALLTLAHEAIHGRQSRVGQPVLPNALIESQAECVGMQDTARVAKAFGDSAADAQSLADFYWLYGYPSMRKLSDPYALARPYWSAQCKPGGQLDERPAGSTVWP